MACSVHQDVTLAVTLERRGDAVAGGAGQIAGQHPFLTQQAVDQGGFADVGPTDHRQLDHALRFLRRHRLAFFARGWERGENFLHQCFDALIVGGGDDVQMIQPEGVKIGAEQVGIAMLGFVDHQMHRLAGAAQLAGDVLVRRCQPAAPIHQQQHGVGFLNCPPRLLLHHPRQTLVLVGQTAGIHHHIGTGATLADAVLAVAGQTGHVRHQRVAGTGQGIEQGGFTDVGSADQGDDGEHGEYIESRKERW